MARTTTEVLQNHLAKRLKGQVEEDIKENYSDDIIILSSFGVFRGPSGVRESAGKLASSLGEAVFHYKHIVVERDYGFLEWTGESDDREVCDGADSFVIENGKIVLQTVHYTSNEKDGGKS